MAMQKRKIRSGVKNESEAKVVGKKTPTNKKVLYLEIDDEITTIYDKINKLRYKKIYLVLPRRAIIFQSAINLKILKRKAEDLGKEIYIVTTDFSGFNLAKRVGLNVQEKLDESPNTAALDQMKAQENQEISPLKASVNSLNEQSPTRREDKKFSISQMVKRGAQGFQIIPKNLLSSKKDSSSGRGGAARKNGGDGEKSGGRGFVLVAPNKRALASLVVVSVLLLLGISYIALPGATLILTPKSNIIEVPKNIILADMESNRAELDTRPNNMIASYKITTQVDKVFTFQATGKNAEGGKSSTGKVKVKNTSPNEWPLVPRTRFQTSDGLIFRSASQVTVPSGNTEKPGELEIQVVADPVDAFNQPTGDRGNIPADTKFFLPALNPENQKKLFAVSSVPFSGGITNVSKFISKEDVAAAKSKMANDLKQSAEAELKGILAKKNSDQNTRLALLIGKGVIETSEPKIDIPNNLEGQKLDSFDIKGNLVATGTAYDLDELLGVLKKEIRIKKNPEKSLASIDEESMTYKIVDVDKINKKVTITAVIQGIEEFEVSPKKENGERLIKKIKESIVGKDIRTARDFVQQLPEIEKVEINTWPAWAPTLPSVPDNIKVEIKH